MRFPVIVILLASLVSGQTSAREEGIVLTPKPPRTPRINGAKVFGVRPGSPFLFTIAATGERPMTFTAEHLPPGLKLDSSSGQITGTLEKRGEYITTLRASNTLGKAERPFKIVCGDALALTPHMGWNSWYIWENNVTDKIIRDAADAMVENGMIHHGYQYVNIDDCWAVKPGAKDPALGGAARDAQGRVNANARFPDMKALTDYIHAKGLKAGIYTSPGPATCAGHIGAYQHEEQDARRFVEWGFDFLKYDWCSYGNIVRNPDRAALQKPYRMIGDILKKQARDLVLNHCQYGMGNVWEWGKEVGGHSWRTAGDLGGSFEGIPAALFRDGFEVYAKNDLHRFGGPGGWNDPDYLLLGYLSNWKGGVAPTPLTPNEQYTHVSLWCLLAAPLIFSGDITRLDEFTLGLLCNDEVIEVDQDPPGRPGQRVSKDGSVEVWAKEMEDGTKAVGLFNRGETETIVTARWSELGLSGRQIVRDLWRQKDLGEFDGHFQTKAPPHGVVMVRLRPAVAPTSPGGGVASNAAQEPAITFVVDEARGELRAEFKGRALLAYAFATNQFKPYVRELRALNGMNVLRDAPPDHLHHHGLMYAIRVNGINFWEERDGPGVQKSIRLIGRHTTRDERGRPQASFRHLIHWMAGSNRWDCAALLVEQRTITLTVDEAAGEVALRWQGAFTVPQGEVTLHGSAYNGLGLRLPETFDHVVEHINSENKPYTAQHQGDVTAARWSALTHESDNERRAMVALFSRPSNKGETRFFTMANPFAYLAVTQNLDRQPMNYKGGDAFNVEYLLTVYSDKKTSEFLEQRQRRFDTEELLNRP